MKILLLTTHLNLGGIGVYVFSLARGLAKKGHEVFVASSGGNLAAILETQGIKHLTVDIRTKSELSPKVFSALSRIRRIVRENDIEIIHAHTRVAQVIAHLVARKTGIIYVTTCHGFFKPRLFRRMLPCWGQRCIAISEAVREHLVNDLKVPPKDIFIVHNGVEIKRFSPEKFTQRQKQAIRRDYGLKNNAPVVGTIARLSSVKGHKFLILAMKDLLEINPDVQLILVGDGPERDSLTAQVKEMGIGRNVFFKPSTFDTSIPLSIMDLFVFPSLAEGLGLAIIEAQAMGLPVVASDVGGIYSLVKDNINGLLVPAQKPQALAQAMLKLLADKKLALRMGREGRIQAREQFNLSRMVEGIEKVYAEAQKK